MPHERQWTWNEGLFSTHPDGHTDAFTLYIKGTCLVSRVKTFNHRFKSKHYSGDPTCAIESSCSESVDPRTTKAFKDVENFVESFRTSFPAQLRNPLDGNIVNPHIYCALLYAHV